MVKEMVQENAKKKKPGKELNQRNSARFQDVSRMDNFGMTVVPVEGLALWKTPVLNVLVSLCHLISNERYRNNNIFFVNMFGSITFNILYSAE